MGKTSEKTLAICKAWRDANPNYQKEWSSKNPEKKKASQKRWRDNNKDRIREYELLRKYPNGIKPEKKKYTEEEARIRARNRYLERRNPDVKLKKMRVSEENRELKKGEASYMREQFKDAMKRTRWNKTGWERIIGCKRCEFLKHLEGLFDDGMTWDNYGRWHIDHVIPISSASDYKHLEGLFHYSNTQPLWADENMKKGSMMPWDWTL